MNFLRSVRITARGLLRAPAYTFVAVSAIALGIGATTTVFSVVDGVLLRPLGYRDADRLVYFAASRGGPQDAYPPSYLDFVDWRGQCRLSSDMAFARGRSMMLAPPRGGEATVAG